MIEVQVFLMALLLAIAVAGLVPPLPPHWRHLDHANKELRHTQRRPGQTEAAGDGVDATEHALTPAARWRARFKHGKSRRQDYPGKDVGMLALEVAALVRSGLDMESAWRTGLERNWDKSPPPATRVGRLPGALAVSIGQARRPLPWWSALESRRRAAHASAATALSSMGVACGASAELGAPLAPVLEAVAQGVARAGEVAHERRVQLAGPLATARVLRVLPLAGLLLGGVLGVNPVGVLLGSMPGLVSLAVGGGAMTVGNVWLTRIVRAAEQESVRVDPAVLVDVCAACLRAGSAVPTVLQALGTALAEVVGTGGGHGGSGKGDTRAGAGGFYIKSAGGKRTGSKEPEAPATEGEGPDARLAREVGQCGQMLLLGASWEVAWERVGPELLPLNRALEAAWKDGAAPEGMLARAATLLRAKQVREARLAAAQLGTKLIGPVSLCMLPAFIALGIVPVLLGGAIGLLSG